MPKRQKAGRPSENLPAGGPGLPVTTEDTIVYGLASSAPLVVFVGDLRGDAAAAGATIAEGLAEAGGAPVDRPPPVCIDGRPVAWHDAPAIPFEPTSAPAIAMTSHGGVDAGGRRLLPQNTPFASSPTGSLTTMQPRQRVVWAQGRGNPKSGVPTCRIEAARGNVRPRTDFSPPSAAALQRSMTSFARLAVPPELAVLVGDPVDVATGAVVSHSVDLAWVAPSLTFARSYNSRRSHRDGPFGFGWTHSFDEQLWLEPQRVVVRVSDGRELELPTDGLEHGHMREGDVVSDVLGRYELRCHGRLRWSFRDGDCIWHFGPVPAECVEDRDRGLCRLTRIVPREGAATELRYDERARLVEIRVGGRVAVEFSYDRASRVAGLWSGSGPRMVRVVQYEYSEAGDLVACRDADGPRHYAYEHHLLVRETGPTGASFYYGYDGFGRAARCIRTWGDDGVLDRALSYEASRTTVIRGNGHRVLYGVSATGLVTSRRDGSAARCSYGYDDALRLSSVGHGDGSCETLRRDARGNIVARTRRDARWRMTYDGRDDLVAGVDPQEGQWCLGRDSRGRLSRVEDPQGHVTLIEHDDARIRIVDPAGQVITASLGPHREVLSIDRPGRRALTYAYDDRGRLVRATTAHGAQVTWTYDGANRIVGIESDSDGDLLRLERDPAGRVIALERPGSKASIERSPAGSIRAIRVGASTWTYDHDREGRLLHVRRDGSTHLRYRRDRRGNVEAYAFEGGVDYVLARCSDTGRVLARTRAGAETSSLTWDAHGRLARCEVPGSGLNEFSYRADGLLSTFCNDHRRCRIERNLRGFVTRQVCDDLALSSRELDHRGRRYGLDVDVDVEDGLRVSYLWTDDDVLGHLAIVHPRWAVDIAVQEARPKQTWAPTGPIRRDIDDARRDALHRPLDGVEGPWFYDEDRPVMQGEDWLVTDPRDDHAWVRVQPDGTCGLEGAAPPDRRTDDDVRVQACFPLMPTRGGIEEVAPTPWAVLRDALGARIWAPQPRPWPGTTPWLPDDWTAEPGDVRLPGICLDDPTLMALLSPFPRLPLRLPRQR